MGRRQLDFYPLFIHCINTQRGCHTLKKNSNTEFIFNGFLELKEIQSSFAKVKLPRLPSFCKCWNAR